MTLAWHFTNDTLRNGRPIPPVGEWLVHEGPVELCVSGLHASIDVWDALQYAPGVVLHRVECEDVRRVVTDKLVCSRRRIIASRNVETLLRRFACDCALSVLPDDAPDIVRRYLTTCDESLRVAARNSAWNSAQYAAWNAARDAAWNAAWNASWNAAQYPAQYAASDADRPAVLNEAWHAAKQRQSDDFRQRIAREFGDCMIGGLRL